MGPNRLKYLDLIQANVTRMAGNQFTLRTWSVGLGSAIIGYAATKDSHVQAAFLGVLSALIFWLLDAYYLALERAYRDLYNRERVKPDDTPTLDLAVNLSAGGWMGAALRPAVWLVHLPVIVLAVIVGGSFWPK